jgi:hypothetical protein
MTLDKKVSDLLSAQIPDYVQEFYPLFVIFVTKYFEWLEQPGNPQEIIQNIQLNTDIDTTASSLATKFMSLYAPSFPQVSALDRTILVKNFREFYRSKGSEESFRYFFRAFFNDEITIKLPGDQLFRPSDADWYVEKKLRVQAVTGDPRKLATVQITGASSNATGVVEEAVQSYGAWDLRLENRSLLGTFNSSETIVGTYYDHVEDTSSQIVVLNTQELQTLPGRQRGSAGLLSSDQVLQDSIYWQKFSYVVRTRINLNLWQDAVLEQLHPTGRNIFGELLLDNSTSMTISSVTQFSQSTVIESEVRLFTSSNSFYLQPGFTWDRIADFRTGTSATTTAGAITFDSDFKFGGENVTFALQGAIDGATVFEETFTFTSITGTIDIAVTTGQTSLFRDFVSYNAAVTSLTGTINAVQQVGGDSITFTGTGTQFLSEVVPSNTHFWNQRTGLDVSQNAATYDTYATVLTIRQLPITGTLTIAAQTPTAPDYLIYVSGTNTSFRSDLLVTGSNTSQGILNETTAPVVEEGQPEPLLFLNSWPITGDVTFTSGSTSVVGVGTAFASEIDLLTSNTLTVNKPLFGRFTQVSTVPAASEFYVATTSRTTNTTISGTTLSFGLTSSNYSSIITVFDGEDRNARYDIPLPFPVQFLTTSTTKLYVHSSGFIASNTSAPSQTNSGIQQFRPFDAPFVGVQASDENNLKSVFHGEQGTAPNRYYTIFYNGTHGRRIFYADYVWNVGGAPAPFNTSMQVRGAATATPYGVIAGMTASTTPTSGTATNGYYQINLPWAIYWGASSYSQSVQTRIFLSNRGILSFGDWIDLNGGTSTQDIFANGLPILNQIKVGSPIEPVTQVNRVYTGTFGITGSRVFLVRFEGDWHTSTTVAAGASRFIVEFNFYETDLYNVGINWGHPPQVNFDYYYYLSYAEAHAIINRENSDGSGSILYNTLDSAYGPYQVDYSTHVGGVAGDSYPNYQVPVTSGLVSWYIERQQVPLVLQLDQNFSFIPQSHQWEIAFPENSSSPYIVRTGNIRSSTRENNLRSYYEYQQNTGTQVSYHSLEWSEGTDSSVSIRNDLVTTVFSGASSLPSLPSSSTTQILFTKFPSSQALTASIPATSLLLLRSWNSYTGSEEIPSSTRTVYAVDYNDGTHSTGNTALFWTGNGVIYRYPQDGFNATAVNLNPNPTLGSSLSNTYRVTGTRFSYSFFFGFTQETVYGTSLGVLFTQGSSAAVHSRFVQTTPGYGITHTITVAGVVGNDAASVTSTTYNNLATVFANQELEAWYATGIDTQPPTAGQSPSALGWTRVNTLASSNDRFVTGSVFNRSYTITTASDTSVTWLIWQKSFTTQTSTAQRLSEYLLTNISTTAVPSASRANSRLVLGSGSVVRIANRTSKAGATVLEDFYVAENPNLRRINGDNYLILRPLGTVTSVPYLASINSWSTGGTTSYAVNNIALQNIPVFFTETRNIASITNQTTLTVTAAWTSTSNRLWGGAAGSGISRRAFAINTVLNDTSLTLRNPSSSTRFNPSIETAVSFTTSIADRRFLVGFVNSDTDLQVSGGGIYANIQGKLATFASPKPVTIDGQTGYLLYGFNEAQANTSLNTRWSTDGLPGTDDQGVGYGTFLADLTAEVGYTEDNNGDGIQETFVTVSSFTVLRVFSNSSILVTGSIITANFLNNNFIVRFPANSSEITVLGSGTIFAPTSVTISSATQTFEEVTEFDFNDRKTGYLELPSGQLLRVINIIDDTTLIVSSLAIRAPIVSSAATSFRRVKGFAPPRALGRPGGASFDKAGASVTLDESLVVQDPSVDYTQILELYHNSSSLVLGSSTVLLSTSVNITASSSIVLLVSWTKDLADSADEVLNQLRITVSSTGTFVAKFDDEVQRNHKDIALGRTQLYSGAIYLNSSNSISSVTGVLSGDEVSSVTWLWAPYNVKRSGTYSRLTALIDSSTVTSISITVETGATESWQSLSEDFLNISVIGTS